MHYLDRRVANKYGGMRVNDMLAYLRCRARIQAGESVKHFLGLKRYYRKMFLASRKKG